MGLDQYVYFAKTKTSKGLEERFYWRKHPNLQGWMERLWRSQNPQAEGQIFNDEDVLLTAADLDDLEKAVLAGALPETTGFFFGQNSDEEHRSQDLEFIAVARAALAGGLNVIYNSNW